MPPKSSHSEHIFKFWEPFEYVSYVFVFQTVEFCQFVLVFWWLHNHIFILVQELEHVAHITKVRAIAQVHDGMGLHIHVEHRYLPLLDEHDASGHHIKV